MTREEILDEIEILISCKAELFYILKDITNSSEIKYLAKIKIDSINIRYNELCNLLKTFKNLTI